MSDFSNSELCFSDANQPAESTDTQQLQEDRHAKLVYFLQELGFSLETLPNGRRVAIKEGPDTWIVRFAKSGRRVYELSKIARTDEANPPVQRVGCFVGRADLCVLLNWAGFWSPKKGTSC